MMHVPAVSYCASAPHFSKNHHLYRYIFRMLPNVRATRAAARTHPHTHAQATVISHPRHSRRQFLVQFGISTSAEKQRHWQSQGNIRDDPRPAGVPFTDGILSFAGYGTDSRSTHLFITLGSQPSFHLIFFGVLPIHLLE